MKFFLLLSFLLAPCIGQNVLDVTIYYESLCPDSIKFITNQFYPAFQEIAPYLKWHFIPYGFAQKKLVDGKWTFSCQHGPKECLGNKGQACALYLAKSEVNKVEYVNCVMGNSNPGSIKALSKCAEKTNLKWSQIDKCLKSTKGDQLLANYGDETAAVKPKIQFIPTITFYNSFNQTLQDAAIEDFLGTACLLLKNEPKVCNSGFDNEMFKLYVNDVRVY